MIIVDTLTAPVKCIIRHTNVAWVRHDAVRRKSGKPNWKATLYHRYIYEESIGGFPSRRYDSRIDHPTGYIEVTELIRELKRWSKDFDLLVAIEATELQLLFIELMEACGVTATPIDSGAGGFLLRLSED